MFKNGDTVIKTGGGNKMKVMEIINNNIKCCWICDEYNEGIFLAEDIINFDDYIKTYDRSVILNEIIN